MADGYLVDYADIKKIAELVKTGDKELANNIKALQYIIDNSNRLNYTGQVITNSNSVVGDIKNVTVSGNTRYKKSDGTYTDTWESGVSLESMGEKEKNSNGKYPITIKSSNDTKEDKRTVLLDSPLRKVGAIADVLDLEKMKVTRKIKSIIIDGTITNWVQAKIDANSILWYIILSDAIPSAPSMCDKLKNDDTLWWHDVLGAYRIDNTKAFQIRTDKTISTLSALTTWLQSNPVTIVYELATPTTENIQVSPTDNPLTSYTPSTTLTTNNTIKGNISADMPTNVNAIITQQASAIASLQDTVLQTQSALIENEYNNLI